MFSKLEKSHNVAIVDGAAFGAYMKNAYQWIKTHPNCSLYAPESFEYLILKSGIFDIKNDILDETYKYVDSNVNCATEEYPQIQEIFNYLGYDIDVIQPRSKPHTQEYCKDDLRKLNEAIAIVKEKKIRPYQIYDQGNYIIVILGGRFFKNGYF